MFKLLTARIKFTKFHVIFQATCQFLHHPSVSWQRIPLKFSNWNICFGLKEPIIVQFFRLLSALMKVHPNPHAIFETTRPGFVWILHNCSVLWKITPLYFFSSNLILWTKIAHQSNIFGLLSGWVKIHQILHVIFETTSQFFFKICFTLQCHER